MRTFYLDHIGVDLDLYNKEENIFYCLIFHTKAKEMLKNNKSAQVPKLQYLQAMTKCLSTWPNKQNLKMMFMCRAIQFLWWDSSFNFYQSQELRKLLKSFRPQPEVIDQLYKFMMSLKVAKKQPILPII